ncbi:hypothetical protein LTR85_001536 [Meristemomyces frigidus]|nr:hypothetical protein LTR85_001536 [Meristemomyces frigidus]
MSTTISELISQSAKPIQIKPELRIQCPPETTAAVLPKTSPGIHTETTPAVSKRQIKLCTIEDGNKNDPIRCTLTKVSLDDPLDYSCLSYVWGTLDDMQTITLNGDELKVTANLFAVLKRLRATGLRSSLWIDALCIKQKNNVHKSAQVAMMGEIYAKAAEVLVWLGPAPEQMPKSTACEQRWYSAAANTQLKEVLGLLAEDVHFHDLPLAVRCRARTCASAKERALSGSYDWEAVLKSLRSWSQVTWFDRAWTVQEIVLAKKARFLLGEDQLDWAIASKACVNLGRHMRTCCSECVGSLPGDNFAVLNGMANRVIDLANAKDRLPDGQHIVQFNWKQATDPLDKLYGLLGLETSPTPTLVVPDYGISLQELFSRFARDLVTSQFWLVPLCLDLVQDIEGLRSWVPDWTARRDNSAAYSVVRFDWSYTYSAVAGLPANPYVDADYILAVDGINVDTIAGVSRAYELTESFANQLATLDAWQNFLDLPVNGEKPYVGGGKLEDAFWWTMMADRFHEDEEARPASLQDVQQLQAYLETARQDLEAYGDDALIGLSETGCSHVMAVLDRRLFQTTQGWIGVCPKAAQVGDEVFVLGDCPCLSCCVASAVLESKRGIVHLGIAICTV